ncbi:MAG: hypothetical protein IJT12_04970 [Paludibacteraceae bacterium]|nr:hypothetical protein [Paludibacteraceae bacterium]
MAELKNLTEVKMLSRVNPSTGLVEILPCLDIRLNDVPMDIKSVTKDGWFGGALVSKNSQLGNVNKKTNVESDCLCLYFHNPDYYSEGRMQNAINYYKNFKKDDGTPIEQRIHRVYVVRKDNSDVLDYEI